MHIKNSCVRCPQLDEALKTSVTNQKRLICSFQCAARQEDETGGSFITIISSWGEEEPESKQAAPRMCSTKTQQQGAALYSSLNSR